MKNIYGLLAIQILCCTVQAQSFWACGRDFLNTTSGLTYAIKYNEYYGKGSSGSTIPGFTDVVYSDDNGEADGDEALKGGSCPVRSNNCLTNDNDAKLPAAHYDGTLKYDVYYPVKANTPISTSPAIFFFHAGGFSDCSYKDLPGITHMCAEFAQRGFVAFNVEYRRGIELDNANPQYTTVEQTMAIYRACQDARGAIRSIIQRQRDGWENTYYKIDETQLYLAGMSAGALLAMNLAYYTTSAQIASVFPTTGVYTAQQLLGPIDADFYYGAPTLTFQANVKGVLAMWGGIPLPKNYYGLADQSGFFSPTNAYNPPLIAFAGFKDDVFPLPVNAPGQKVTFSDQFFSESRCLPNTATPYKVDKFTSTPDLTMGSTLNMYTILKKLSVPAEMYIDCQMGHGLDNKCSTKGCYTSEFGTGDNNPTDVQTYMVQRACIFFQDNQNSITNMGTTQFNDCENKRVACNGTYTGCSTAAACQ